MAMQAARARVLGRSLASSRPCALPRFQPSRLRQQSTATGAEAGASGPPPPPPTGKASVWRRFLQTTGGVTLVTVAGGVAFYYFAQKDKTPGTQLPHDPSKKTLVVCGSGWGATSLLNSLDTQDYNVILISPRNYFLFTPLLPSVAVGTLAPRSILQRESPHEVSAGFPRPRISPPVPSPSRFPACLFPIPLPQPSPILLV
uniref:NADH:ubiquinone reductase (non-electrogenic) n=1 Tax=Ganoderma boninense TaxID=34458 RepID=A0A5K1JSX3_9APHY|nr:Probable membrane NADH dehydrogenase NdhA [Ganoderma boninense]